jgi:segregation and condensation protein B
MSLKAKIEAVIYAAEEPVTLAQLTAVFGPEILASLPTEPEISLAEATLDAEEISAANAPATETAIEANPTQAALPIAGATVEEGTKLARQRDRQVRAVVESLVHELISDYVSDERGMEIREIAGGYRLATKAQYHDGVRAFVKRLKPPMKLSLQALETLAVVAYKQPVTAPEISEIRGVDSGGVLGSLISRKLIATAGRKQVIGRPILYKTTKEFLLRFGLKDINDLPSIEEFEKMAAEMEDAEAIDPSLHENSEAELTGENIAEDASDADFNENETVMVTNSETPEESQP